VRFDLSAIPAGSTVSSASLSLNMSRAVSGPNELRVHRLTSSWGESTSDGLGNEGSGDNADPGDATWSRRFHPGTLWTTPGGDYVATQSASQTVGAVGTYTWTSAALTADVQGFVDDPGQNFGWILIGVEIGATTTKRFDAREHPIEANRPALVVDFTPPPPGMPFCFGVGCPCGNDSPTSGCSNSSGHGALLSGVGSTSVAADDLVLTTVDCPPQNFGLYFMGASTFAPIQLGDGLACTGGVFRYFPAIARADGILTLTSPIASAYPGAIQPGDTRHFQSWTRDFSCGPPPAPCVSPCGRNSSVSNGYSVVFTP
jgi:hypothetical protein